MKALQFSLAHLGQRFSTCYPVLSIILLMLRMITKLALVVRLYSSRLFSHSLECEVVLFRAITMLGCSFHYRAMDNDERLSYFLVRFKWLCQHPPYINLKICKLRSILQAPSMC